MLQKAAKESSSGMSPDFKTPVNVTYKLFLSSIFCLKINYSFFSFIYNLEGSSSFLSYYSSRRSFSLRGNFFFMNINWFKWQKPIIKDCPTSEPPATSTAFSKLSSWLLNLEIVSINGLTTKRYIPIEKTAFSFNFKSCSLSYKWNLKTSPLTSWSSPFNGKTKKPSTNKTSSSSIEFFLKLYKRV